MKAHTQHHAGDRDIAIRLYNQIRSDDIKDLPDGYSGHRPASPVWLIKNVCFSMIVLYRGDCADLANSLMFEETPEHYAFHLSFYELADLFAESEDGNASLL